MKLPVITKENFFLHLGQHERPWQKDYLAMYSSQFQGITMDPDLMVLPVDDHLVHRGDGVFDVMRCVNGKIYLREAHLNRLERSARAISLGLPPEYVRVRDLVNALVTAGGEKDCLVRIVISRGPGSFGANPFDCPSSQIYINVVRFRGLDAQHYKKGITLVTSRIPIKRSFFANIKSCNYLPNVLMKMEAVQAGCQYSVGLDEDGYLAEGSIENIGVVTADGMLEFPETDRTLAGITAKRVSELAEKLVEEKRVRGVRFTRITPHQAYRAKEIFLTGTSINILPVVQYDGRPVGRGCPGPVCLRLSDLLWQDMTHNTEMLSETGVA
ncbi:MAG: aminodeoxychorismate lyase [Deltaproteobacteria bacterium]|nr:MAG: aminodeoxychorismate lyase [Deltaproteobacteria bacterium]